MKATMQKVLPLKTDVYLYSFYNSPFTVDEMIAGLTSAHGEEGQFTLKVVEKYLLAYCGVSIIGPSVAHSGEHDGELKFTVTPYGKQLIKYLGLGPEIRQEY